MSTKLVSAVTATLALLPSVAAGQDRFSLAGDRVAIYNLAGEVRVEAGSGGNVVVEITRSGRDAGQLSIDRGSRQGWQTLVVRYPRGDLVYPHLGRNSRSDFNTGDDGFFGLRNLDPALGAERLTANTGGTRGGRRVRVRGSGSGLQAHADMRVAVPAGKAVAVHLGVGRISIRNTNGSLQIDTRSGAVSGHNVAGFLRIDTGSGAITLTDATGDVALRTGSGSINVRNITRGVLLAHTGSGSIQADAANVPELAVETGSGSVSLNGISARNLRVHTGSGGIRARRVQAENLHLDTGSGSVNLELLTDVRAANIETGSGGITITAPATLGAELTVETGSGAIDVGLPMQVFERRRDFLRARIGDGAGTMRLETGSGGVNLRSN